MSGVCVFYRIAVTNTMERRNFIKNAAGVGALGLMTPASLSAFPNGAEVAAEDDRTYWVNMLVKIADPVLTNLAASTLKKNMPVECKEGQEASRRQVTYLEAFGRLLSGMAPWLASTSLTGKEEELRKKYATLSRTAISKAVDPGSPDFMNFTEHAQPLVDAAFLAHALIRAPKELWESLDSTTKLNLKNAFVSSRVIRPYHSNWILFSAMVEAALAKFYNEGDAVRIELAVRQMESWYKGDGVFGDGEDFHWDYYNSYVIQPFLLDITATMIPFDKRNDQYFQKAFDKFLKIGQRYAAIQERLIMADGSFPPIGRSLPYRIGAFQLLAQITLMEKLSEGISPASIRSALTTSMKKIMGAEGTFDKNGWLTIGFCGHQPAIAEGYISTGSLYLCSMAFLPLGLPPNNSFWSTPAADWTSKKIWNGVDVPADHAMSL
ncbi:conserved hypothetical protein [Imperialibacter sp. EC-SDR9]|nr:conserved hypothetical protein [Imperialibacter sp. 89]CAD5263821.1 conserved hypothetical protein [Imperialibacter sp. 75]VVT07416.1 conserved hypothetical protein [Imperialibacter sp. EC-SDR9]